MTVQFQDRQIDPISLWGQYVEFPPNWNPKPDDEFSPLVRCPNPDHHTEKRHFQINLHQATVHCFAHCGISGTYESAVAKIEGVTNRQARKSILKHSRLGKPAHVRRKRSSDAASPVPVMDNSYDRYLPQIATDFLAKRGFQDSTIAAHELGWDADTLRVVIPVKNKRGQVRFLIRRTVKPGVEPRYLYPDGSEKSRYLYGIDNIDLGMVKSEGIVLVEGSFDRMKVWQHGLRNSGAILGSKLSEIQAQQIANLRPPRIYTMFDADGSGLSATISVAKLLRSIPIYVCRYPKGKYDPDETTQEEAYRMISRAVPFSKFRQLQTRRKEISVG